MGYVVVTLTRDLCPESDVETRCLMDVIGPFETREAARDLAATFPAWTTPHIMRLATPADYCYEAGAVEDDL